MLQHVYLQDFQFLQKLPVPGQFLDSRSNRLKTASKQEVLNWLQEAQTYLTSQSPMVTGSFKVTGISTAANGSEDHLVRNPDILQELQDAEDSGEELVSDEDSDPFAD